MPKSLYIHIPFCKKICSYCDFCKVLYNDTFVDKYLDQLEKEVINNYKNEVLDTIYIGGGTPSVLSIKSLKKLFSITNRLKRSADTEFTIECNFDSTSKEKIDLFVDNGINRISFGLETTNPKYLKELNREFDKDEVIKTIDYCNEVGLENINIDLIYALNGERIEDIKKDLDFITSLNIKHISTYSLIIEKNTLLSINNYEGISQDLDYEMYKFICDYLKNKNYIHYEISNFSKDKYESKHNRVYWLNNEYYGFGIGASSYIENKRITNSRSITKYNKGIIEKNIEVLTKQDIMDYQIILNLRLKEGISKKKFFDRFNISIDDIYNYHSLVSDKLLCEDLDNIWIDEDNWYISNEIIVRFLEEKKYE